MEEKRGKNLLYQRHLREKIIKITKNIISLQKDIRFLDKLEMTTMSALLQIKNLKVSFLRDGEWNEAVHGVSFEVPKGKTLGIVGESGSGKSVSNLAVMRLLNEKQSRITADEITLDGKDILHLSENEMHDIRGKRIAMIFQEPMTSLNPVFQCGFQVTEAILSHENVTEEEAKSRVISLFKKVMLPRPEAIYKSYPHELSGGQKQRVMIAMALACNPELLIADEPTTALDVTVQKEILKLLKELQQSENLSMIFISHDLGVVSEVSDYILVMHNGRVVEFGESQEILNNPQDPYTKGLLACRPPMDYRLKRLPIVKEFLDAYASVFNGSGRAWGVNLYNDFRDAYATKTDCQKRLNPFSVGLSKVIWIADAKTLLFPDLGASVSTHRLCIWEAGASTTTKDGYNFLTPSHNGRLNMARMDGSVEATSLDTVAAEIYVPYAYRLNDLYKNPGLIPAKPFAYYMLEDEDETNFPLKEL